MPLVLIPIILFGIALGSFLNVIVLRYPEQPLTGRSHCPNCNRQLSAPELIPILSYIFIKGRCANCHTKISPQYPIVELAIGIIAVLIFNLFFIGSLSLANALVQFLIIYVLIILFLIDLRTLLLPDLYIVILTGLAIFNHILTQASVVSSVSGALIGTGALFGLWLATLRIGGMGFGDVKLMIPIGLLFGPANTILLLYSSFMLGGLVGLILLIFRKAKLKTAVPFGPFLAGVAIIYILFPKVPAFLLELIT